MTQTTVSLSPASGGNAQTPMELKELRTELNALAKGNQEFIEFTKRTINTNKAILGVRTPDIRKLAKSAAKTTDFAWVKQLLGQIDIHIYEEILFAGLLINYTKLTDLEKLTLTRIYLKKCDNWALIDTFVEIHRRKYDRKFWWNYSLQTLKSHQEFTVRYGIVNLMSNYLDTEYLERTLTKIRQVKLDKYYAKMAQAWLYATAAVHNFDRIIAELKDPAIDSWIRKKACQKILESYRITSVQKSIIRTFRDVIVQV